MSLEDSEGLRVVGYMGMRVYIVLLMKDMKGYGRCMVHCACSFVLRSKMGMA
jgi:hypothetical protein